MYNLPEFIADSQLFNPFRAAVQESKPVTALRCAKLKITPRCNLKCTFCHYWQMDPQDELDTAAWKRILDELAELHCAKVHFSGGEPLLRPDLPELLRHARDRGMRANLTTNATLLTSERLARALVDTGVKGVSVSLDGPTAKVHDRLRGVPGAFRRTRQGLGQLLAASAHRGGKTKVRINTVLTRSNYTYLPEVLKLAGELGCSDVIPMPVDDRGGRRVRLSKGQLQEYNQFVAPQVRILRQRYGFPMAPERIFPYGTTAEDLKLARRGAYARHYFKHHPCYVPWLHLFIGWNGDVYLCCMARGKTPPVGNVNRQSLRDLFTGPVYQRIREGFLQQRPAICHRCDNFLVENRLLEEQLR